VEGLGESAGVSHGEATLGGSGSYVNMDAIVYRSMVTKCTRLVCKVDGFLLFQSTSEVEFLYRIRRRCIIDGFAFDKDRVLV
jgi:hypothetical protein